VPQTDRLIVTAELKRWTFENRGRKAKTKLVATSLEVLLVPGCCKNLHSGCYFDVRDSRTLLKRGLCLVCPICHKVFSASRALFDALGLLNFALIDTNDTLDKAKKSGFLLVVELPAELHPYILKILNPYFELGPSFSYDFDVGLAVTILGSPRLGDNTVRVAFPHREFRLTRECSTAVLAATPSRAMSSPIVVVEYVVTSVAIGSVSPKRG